MISQGTFRQIEASIREGEETFASIAARLNTSFGTVKAVAHGRHAWQQRLGASVPKRPSARARQSKTGQHMRTRTPSYEPIADVIEAACEAFRESWSAQERMQRHLRATASTRKRRAVCHRRDLKYLNFQGPWPQKRYLK